MTGWNLPPGVTQRMIDEAAGGYDEPPEPCPICGDPECVDSHEEPDDTYVVICRDDSGAEPIYTLATRRVFDTLAAAQEYALPIAPSRLPLIVSGRWHQLRRSTS